MFHLLFILLYTVQIIHGRDNSVVPTVPTCHPHDGEYHIILGILASCALTLLICVWQAIHPDVPPQGWYRAFWKLSFLFLALRSLLLPEWTVYLATKEWRAACRNLKKFREKAREHQLELKWSMTHSFFAQMGGLVYHDDKDSKKTIHWSEYLELYHADKIANPDITEEEIKDKSKTDALGKTILFLQLTWFIVQVAVRYFHRFVVTLVELDTVCMAVLTLFLLVFWRNKPLRPEWPYILYSRRYRRRDSKLLDTRDEEKGSPGDADVHDNELTSSPPSFTRQLNDFLAVDEGGLLALCATWIIFGGLHLAAWNYEFVTNLEMNLWRVASAILTIAPLSLIIGKGLTFIFKCLPCDLELMINLIERTLLILALALAFLSRIVLIALALASLRSLPCIPYETLTWIAYVPHFQVFTFSKSV